MNYIYDNHFNSNYQNLPVAYYKQQTSTEKMPLRDEEGNYIFTALHNHAEFEIILFTKGSGVATVGSNGKKVVFEEGDFLLINPFEPHTGYFFADNRTISHMCLDFSVSIFEHPLSTIAKNLSDSLLDQSIRCEPLFSHKEERYEALKNAFLDMYNAISNDGEDDLLFLAGLFRFFSTINASGKIHHAETVTVTDPNIEFVKQVLDYIERNYAETIYTRDIAKELTYNKAHFCRLFKKHFNVSLTDFLTQFRIEKAKVLLLRESSTKVAEQCGFSSQSNFAKSFKEHVGITPAKYRKFVTGE